MHIQTAIEVEAYMSNYIPYVFAEVFYSFQCIYLTFNGIHDSILLHLNILLQV